MRRLAILGFALLAFVPASLWAQAVPEPVPIDPWTAGAHLDALAVDIAVRDGAVVADYALTLSNPGHGLAEGHVVVPVPPGSAVTDLVLVGGPETLEGKLLDAGDAQRIYHDIVRRLIDPALLQSLSDTLYEVRAFPVPAGEERQVRFRVTTPLTAIGDEASISIPWSRMSPRPARAVVDVEIDVSWEVRTAVAPTYALDVGRVSAGRLDLSWESPPDWQAGTDFTLYLRGGAGLLETQTLAYRLAGEDGYFGLLFAPALDPDARIDRDVIVVIDTSGSMEGEKLQQAQAAAAYILERLGSGDRFGIVGFARQVRSFGDGLHPSGETAVGIDFVNALVAGGGTNIAGALGRAFSLASGDRPATIVFLTDGLPTVGPEHADAILDLAHRGHRGRTQLFTFGVGFEVDTILLDALADTFVGTSHYVTPGERIDREVARLFERISTPVLTAVDLTITLDDAGDIYAIAPATLTGIFAGTQVLLTGRYDGAGPATVVVTGEAASGPVSFTYRVDLPARATADPTIAQLWAQQRVADLLTELRVEGARDALIREIVDLATQFGIVTPYTSYLAEEPQVAFADDQAFEAVADAAAATPASGAEAVGRAESIEALRGGDAALGSPAVPVVGTHSFVESDGAWVQTDYAGQAAPEVPVDSPQFVDLMQAQPELVAAARLGNRVVAGTPEGFVTIVWPDPDNATVPDLPAPSDVSLSNPPGGPEQPGAHALRTPADPDPAGPPQIAGPAASGGADTGLWAGIAVGLALLVAGGLTGLAVRRRRAR